MRLQEKLTLHLLLLRPLMRYGLYALASLLLFGVLLFWAHWTFLAKTDARIDEIEAENYAALSGVIVERFTERFELLRQQLWMHSKTFDQLQNAPLNDESALWREHAGFFLRVEENRSNPYESSVYAANLLRLQPSDVHHLSRLHALLPTVRTHVEESADLVRAAWVYLDKRYALHYPAIRADQTLSPEYDITEEPIYYQLDAMHNPDRQIRLITYFDQPWSVDAGEIGSLCIPLYRNGSFVGVSGFALNVRGLGALMEQMTLPSGVYALLLGGEGHLLVSSDETQSRRDWGIDSWYAQLMHQETVSPHLQILSNSAHAQLRRFEYELEGGVVRLVIIVRAQSEVSPAGAWVMWLIWGALMAVLGGLFTRMHRALSAAAKHLEGALAGCEQRSGIAECDASAQRHSQERARLLRDSTTALGNALALDDALREHDGMRLMLFEIGAFEACQRRFGAEGAKALLQCAAALVRQEDRLKGYRIDEARFALLGDADPEVFQTLFNALKSASCPYAALHLRLEPYAAFATEQPLYDRALSVLSVAKAQEMTNMVTCKAAAQIESLFRGNLETAMRLEQALQMQTLTLWLQGVYHLEKRKICRYEAITGLEKECLPGSEDLMRTLGAMGRSAEVSRMMVRMMFAQAARYPEIDFSITLEATDVSDETLWHFIDEHRHAHGLNPARITFALREEAAAKPDGMLLHGVEALKKSGFRLALDGVGAGCVSLEMLGTLRCDEWQLSSKLVARLIDDPLALETLRLLTRMAMVLGASCVAKGVDNETLADLLRNHRITMLQGDAIAPIREAEEALRLGAYDDISR